MEESYEINYIAVKGGSIKIRYSVSPTGGVPEENIVSRSDKPHEDFQRACDPELRLVQIALYALLGITIIANNWR